MSIKIDNLDEVIEKITEKVAERLIRMGLAPTGTSGPSGSVSCSLEASGDCNNCGHCVEKNSTVAGNIVNLGAVRLSANPGIKAGNVSKEIAATIDHTLLKPEASRDDLIKLCTEAKQYGFATCCVNAANIPLVARELRGSSVLPIAVVGFPLGAGPTQAKCFEAKEAICAGAKEIDMVINIGELKSRNHKFVFEDIKAVVDASRPHKVKVIIETSALDHDEKVAACVLAKAADAAFVKTSTGFGKGGATVEDIILMRKMVGNDMEVKASGGIKSREDAETLIKAGANRLGCSAGVAIVTGKKSKTGGY